MMIKHLKHGYHVVESSPWPVISSFNILSLFISLILFMNSKITFNLNLSLVFTLLNMYFWWLDVHRESCYQGFHNIYIMKLIKYGMVLFIISELLFFFSFFWESLHYMLVIDSEFSFFWPPKGLIFFSPLSIPLLNTIVLLSSGVTGTYSHYLFMSNNYKISIFYLSLTVLLGVYFSMLQSYEYYNAFFSISDSVFGSSFYMITGFHGLHVIIGSLFLMISMIRMMKFYTTSDHNLNLDMSLWYWHFVDVIWLFLYLIIYIWNS